MRLTAEGARPLTAPATDKLLLSYIWMNTSISSARPLIWKSLSLNIRQSYYAFLIIHTLIATLYNLRSFGRNIPISEQKATHERRHIWRKHVWKKINRFGGILLCVFNDCPDRSGTRLSG